MSHWNWPLIFIACACVCIWTAIVGLVVGEGWLRVPGIAGVVLFVAAAFLYDLVLRRVPNPEVEGEDPDPFAEIEYLDWEHFPGKRAA